MGSSTRPDLPCALIADASVPIASHALSNGVIEAAITDDVGGRVLSFNLIGKPNFLLAGQIAAPKPGTVNAASNHVPYNGHEIWIGPQSQWWAHQKVNPARAAAKADWPPDPYLSLAKNSTRHKSDWEMVLDSPVSAVNGLQMRKRFALNKDKPNSMELHVSASNRRGGIGAACDVSIQYQSGPHPLRRRPEGEMEAVKAQLCAFQAGRRGGTQLRLYLEGYRPAHVRKSHGRTNCRAPRSTSRGSWSEIHGL